MNNKVTTFEQSKRLYELGVRLDTEWYWAPAAFDFGASLAKALIKLLKEEGLIK